jgi:hypothetical protein
VGIPVLCIATAAADRSRHRERCHRAQLIEELNADIMDDAEGNHFWTSPPTTSRRAAAFSWCGSTASRRLRRGAQAQRGRGRLKRM